MEKTNLGRKIGEILSSSISYRVPLYQREFAWTENEIQQLVEDIYENYTINKSGSYFIGSLVVIKRDSELFEVIDGQQRLTVLTLLAKYFKPGEFTDCLLSYDSRDEISKFLNSYYQNFHEGDSLLSFVNKQREELGNCKQLGNITDALITIDECAIQEDYAGETNSTIKLEDLIKDDDFVDYFFNHVIIIWSEMPEDTNVADYFEIMNNSGEQLKKHEILKSLMMGKLVSDSKSMAVFSRIWDACAYMDDHVERFFKKKERDILFGEYVNGYHPDNILDICGLADEDLGIENADSIDSIIGNEKYSASVEKRKDESEEIQRSEAVIDFPNFLMHIFRLLYDTEYKENDGEASIPLNEKDLIKVYKSLKDKIDPIEFIKKLLYYRVVFDRYIVRLSEDDDDKDGKWTLKRPQVYKDKDNNYKLSFEKNTFDDRNNDFVVKAISMLQVSFPQRKYKNYLNNILSWFNEKSYSLEMSYADYIASLNNYIFKCYDSYQEDFQSREKDLMCSGTQTPRFILNYIDYLYFLEGSAPFSFKYYNSVEHHMPQSTENFGKTHRSIIDNIGNLYLLSKRENSSLNDHNEIRKVEQAMESNQNIAPKRRRMYDLTLRSPKEWTEARILEHRADIDRLLSKRNEIGKQKQMDLYDPNVCRALLCITDYSNDSVDNKGEKFQLMPALPACYEDNDVLENAKKELLSWLMENKDKTAEDFVNIQLENPNSGINKPDKDWLDWRKAFVKYGCFELIIKQNRSGLVNFSGDGNITIMDRTRMGTAGDVNLKIQILISLLNESSIDFDVQDKNTVLEIFLDESLKISKTEVATLWVYLNAETQDWEYVFEADKGFKYPDGFEKVKQPQGFVGNGIYFKKIGQEKLVEDRNFSYIESAQNALNAINKILVH